MFISIPKISTTGSIYLTVHHKISVPDFYNSPNFIVIHRPTKLQLKFREIQRTKMEPDKKKQ